MKSKYDMTADEISAARKSGAKIYGTVMRRAPRVEGERWVYSDVEDFCPFTLRKEVADMRAKGWREMPDNRYMRADCHYEEACKRADVNLQNLAFWGDCK